MIDVLGSMIDVLCYLFQVSMVKYCLGGCKIEPIIFE